MDSVVLEPASSEYEENHSRELAMNSSWKVTTLCLS